MNSNAEINFIEIKLVNESYKIFFGKDYIENSAYYIKDFTKTNKIAIITDKNTANLYLNKISRSLLDNKYEVIHIILESGEKIKNLSSVENVINNLLETRFERNDLIIGLGGGVIGDLAGFIASIIHRGVDFINFPTTLLAQVDSSIGGKTGVNTKYGKNLIGSFKQPLAVFSDTASLSTLPIREIKAGYSELVKHALIKDKELFFWLCKNWNVIFNQDKEITKAIKWSSKIKAMLVQEDVKERGSRALLNLGHTYAHAIESLLKYDGTILHGEAVSVGILLAYQTSYLLGHSKKDELNKIIEHFNDVGLATDLKKYNKNNINSDILLNAMNNDKKVKSGQKTFIIPQGIGQAFISNEINDEIIKSVIDTALAS